MMPDTGGLGFLVHPQIEPEEVDGIYGAAAFLTDFDNPVVNPVRNTISYQHSGGRVVVDARTHEVLERIV